MTSINVSKHTWVEVDVDLDDFDDEDLIEHLRARGYSIIKAQINVLQESALDPQKVYEAVVLKKPNAEQMMRDFIAISAGRVTL